MSNTAANNVAIRNILYMIAYATGISGSDAEAVFADTLKAVGKEPFDGLGELFAIILNDAVKREYLRGLERVYSPHEEPLAVLRGRPLIQKSIALKARGTMRLQCLYDSFTANTYMNQIVKTAIIQLIRSHDVSPRTRKGLRASALYLSTVDSLEANSIDWRLVRYNKLNQSYRFLMAVCRMVLEKSIPVHDENGNAEFSSMLSSQRLSSLFEKFIREYYRRHFPRLMPAAPIVDYGIGVRSQYLPRLRTDVVLTGPSYKLVIDAKCYGTILGTHFEKKILSPEHRNQIFSYVMHCAQRNASVSGMLLYAQTSMEGPLDECWYELGHWFYLKTLDLNKPFENIAEQLNEIGDRMMSGLFVHSKDVSERELLEAEKGQID